MFDFSTDRFCDVAIVGGGPAGLAAAVYLARFQRSVVVFDAGDARAKLIPRTFNCPGFPEGISGEDLLSRLREQATASGADIVHNAVENIAGKMGRFSLATANGCVMASRVILATGIVDRAPDISDLRQAVLTGALRLCPICDAYEARGQRIAVTGPEDLALREALFLADYSPNVCLLFNYPSDVSEATRAQAASAGIEIWDIVDDLVPRSSGFEVVMADGLPARQIDVVYASMGCDVRSELAIDLDVRCDEDGYIQVGQHSETSVPGIYAIGDVAKALNQIAVGFGHAATASSHIHNSLRERASTQRKWAPLGLPKEAGPIFKRGF